MFGTLKVTKFVLCTVSIQLDACFLIELVFVDFRFIVDFFNNFCNKYYFLFVDTTEEDILEFFGDLVPGSYEWTEGNSSCIVVWALKTTAARALLCLSRPVRYS